MDTDIAQPPARLEIAAVLLDDGRVLIIDVDPEGYGLSGAELFDPGSRSLSPTGPPIHAAHAEWVSVPVRLADGRVLLAFVNGDDAMDFELYDPAKGTFAPAAVPGQARAGATVTGMSDGRVLVAGGSTPRAQGADLPEDPISSAEIFR